MVNITTPLLIIGAALPRSGTMSIKEALETLGYKVYHGTTGFQDPKWGTLWYEVAEADLNDNIESYRAAMDRVVEEMSADGFTAIIDQPGCWVYQDLIEHYYPNAKVLNTKRTSKDAWAKSMVEMAYSLDLLAWQPPHSLKPFRKEARLRGYWCKHKLGIRDSDIFQGGVPFNGTNHLEAQSSVSYATCEAGYERYQATVQATVHPSRLVEYNVKEGWGPLCKHFGQPGFECPTGKFPRVNSNEAGFLFEWRMQLQAEIDLYNLHPLLAQKRLLGVLVYCRKNCRHSILALLGAMILSYVLATITRRTSKILQTEE
jgi:hypothetical protein